MIEITEEKIEDLKRNFNEQRKDRKYLSELFEDIEIDTSLNNMILALPGSGKSYFILKTLVKRYDKIKLMLVSTTSLKETLEKYGATYTTKDLPKANWKVRSKAYKIDDKDVYVMTYSEFGSRIIFGNQFLENVSAIFCDEFHSLFEYYSFNKDGGLASAIKLLLNLNEGIDIYYFTATTEHIDNFERVNKGKRLHYEIYENINVHDFLERGDVMRYFDGILRNFSEVDEIVISLNSIKDLIGRQGMGMKGVIFNERISSMKKVNELLDEKGYTSISIWSINNKDNPMSDEQISVRKQLLKSGTIPDKYDFIVINGSMREGWDLEDERVGVVVLNTLDSTNKIQARGRVRNDIIYVIERTHAEMSIEDKVLLREKEYGIIKDNLDKPLLKKDTDLIAKRFGITRKNNTVVKWSTIRKAIRNIGYLVNSNPEWDPEQKRTIRITVISEPVEI